MPPTPPAVAWSNFESSTALILLDFRRNCAQSLCVPSQQSIKTLPKTRRASSSMRARSASGPEHALCCSLPGDSTESTSVGRVPKLPPESTETLCSHSIAPEPRDRAEDPASSGFVLCALVSSQSARCLMCICPSSDSVTTHSRNLLTRNLMSYRLKSQLYSNELQVNTIT